MRDPGSLNGPCAEARSRAYVEVKECSSPLKSEEPILSSRLIVREECSLLAHGRQNIFGRFVGASWALTGA